MQVVEKTDTFPYANMTLSTSIKYKVYKNQKGCLYVK